MPDFVLSYRNPKGYLPTPETRAAWWAWFAEMGPQLVDIGRPVTERSSIGESDPALNELGGYSIVRAGDLEAAVAIAKGCPHLQRGGGVEVGLLDDVSDADRPAR